MRDNIIFIGEDNKTNSALYQLLNWRFNVFFHDQMKNVSFHAIKMHPPTLVVASMIGNSINYNELFEYLKNECPDIPVITVGNETESDRYSEFYETGSFHKVLCPVAERHVLEICMDVAAGREYSEEKYRVFKNGDKPHILIVDDNAVLLRNIKSILDNKYSVAVAASGFQAFISIGKKTPDLILLDYEMPEMNGKEVIEKLQTDEELKEIPIVFLTSMDSREIVMELLALKPAGYFLKPADSEALIEKIEGILGR